MRIVACYWHVPFNVLRLLCKCGKKFDHSTAKWWASCPHCGGKEHLEKIRERYVEEEKK